MNTELCTSKRTGVMAVSMMVLMTLSHAVSTCMNSMLSIIRLLWRWYIVVRVAREELPDLDLPPGDMGFPFIGETMDFLNDEEGFCNEKMRRYGSIYKSHLFLNPIIRVVGADNVKKILMGENTIVTAYWPQSVRLLIGEGAISQTSGYVHKIKRRNVMHALSRETLEEMIPFIQDCVTSVLTDWKSRRDIVTYPECKQMAFRISACALIGIKPNEHKIGEMHEIFEDFTRSIFSIPVNFPGFGFRQALKAKKQLHAIIREVIADVQKGPSTPVMTAIFKSSEALGEDREESLIEVVVDLLFAGHETLASATTNSVMFLGQRKDVVKKLLDEIRHKLCNEQNDMVVDGYDCATDSLSFQKINELKYLNNVVNEVLRLLPPAGAGYRKVLKSFELGGFLIPKGWVVMYGIRDTHITSPVFENAADFDPDRWADIDASSSDGHNKARFQFLPFSYGARGCIGKTFAQLVLKIFIIELVQQCEWQLRNDRPKIRFAPMPVPADNLTIAVKPRTVK